MQETYTGSDWLIIVRDGIGEGIYLYDWLVIALLMVVIDGDEGGVYLLRLVELMFRFDGNMRHAVDEFWLVGVNRQSVIQDTITFL